MGGVITVLNIGKCRRALKQEKGGTKVTCPGVVESAGKADGGFICHALDELLFPSGNETDCYILFIFQMEGKAKNKQKTELDLLPP